ncbi:tRNA (adenosine(37)-N6)-threonylcarbamoyltransferase complex dimerization subunit type 1 TsaB [Aetokthonos hydrillicola Thurmond2011]|uniref:tRNA (Adenosine(37)-N6)-threonylcarbamoyltransferase complex dimerization subunit type 1 TsaB n=1 Tax=Aetokthonos hydrillicola Thurmond2011 TaxID=2712845 RepID=A0AAP5IAQ1_9CYAN|nr:tRNA (adenosine(37)-N6)-threonylcarbamoyltransferase complex dimerization subunit type 1 TsaB [Aetokthonos hydrillicola]MBO3460424.1 tRNA (adenosine(37)-N6)-threonylcarbamoyltransferase complex dimerization subunit type 1 TsaB [Aetokthonos hydrillicola CCALA 1050]MBW4588500.1 tRNA (adenosine(37)-N6)-threonylcarbamoyltransferase complex dimerization subunit type 1 TsaB [Aetokthonos hydrillicola CCALA 1050]MDR9896829.1 tRNA (adenosine(37)-N6)-threonylcarbamoyltransferase complex dimerization su
MTTQLQQLEPTKYGLALHTTTPELGLAMSNFAGDIRSGVWNLERELSSQLHKYLLEFIQPQIWADLEFIAVAKGPGGFTGTRIGVVTARTLGQQLGIPVFAISTLAAVARSRYAGSHITSISSSMKCEQAIAVQMPAQQGKIFTAIYQPTPDGSDLRVLFPDTVLTPEAWQEKLATWETSYQLIEAKSGLAATVTIILELAYLEWQCGKRPDWSEALPYYGQHPVTLS